MFRHKIEPTGSRFNDGPTFYWCATCKHDLEKRGGIRYEHLTTTNTWDRIKKEGRYTRVNA